MAIHRYTFHEVLSPPVQEGVFTVVRASELRTTETELERLRIQRLCLVDENHYLAEKCDALTAELAALKEGMVIEGWVDPIAEYDFSTGAGQADIRIRRNKGCIYLRPVKVIFPPPSVQQEGGKP